jgi:hypothetical protein
MPSPRFRHSWPVPEAQERKTGHSVATTAPKIVPAMPRAIGGPKNTTSRTHRTVAAILSPLLKAARSTPKIRVGTPTKTTMENPSTSDARIGRVSRPF